jgi:hypothetical protein
VDSSTGSQVFFEVFVCHNMRTEGLKHYHHSPYYRGYHSTVFPMVYLVFLKVWYFYSILYRKGVENKRSP